MNSRLNRAGNRAARAARVGICAALLFCCQVGLSFLPNTELVSLLTILFTLALGKEAFLTVTVFSLLEGLVYGFGLWVISYLYVWPLLVLLTLLANPLFQEDFMLWAAFSAAFGLIFGALFAVAYLPVNPSFALTYWIAGLPWDAWHAVCNGVLMLLLGKPLNKVLKRVRKL